MNLLFIRMREQLWMAINFLKQLIYVFYLIFLQIYSYIMRDFNTYKIPNFVYLFFNYQISARPI